MDWLIPAAFCAISLFIIYLVRHVAMRSKGKPPNRSHDPQAQQEADGAVRGKDAFIAASFGSSVSNDWGDE